MARSLTRLVAILMFSLITVPVGAQPANFDAISDGTDALADALLATPNRETPVPDVNLLPPRRASRRQQPGWARSG